MVLRHTICHRLVIGSAIAVMSIILSAAAYILRDGMDPEYSGALPKLASRLVPTSMLGEASVRFPWTEDRLSILRLSVQR
jgi:hypothetical protein